MRMDRTDSNDKERNETTRIYRMEMDVQANGTMDKIIDHGTY